MNLNRFVQKIKLSRKRSAWKFALKRLRLKLAVIKRRLLSPHPSHFPVGNLSVGKHAPVFIIAEIGVNHEGNLEDAKKLIKAAKEAGANAVKFQKRNLEASYQKNILDNPQLSDQSLNYLVPILKETEFGEQEYRELKKYAAENNIILFVTPFDEPSVDFVSRILAPSLYKVASADLVNLPLLERLVKEKKPLLLSTGMSKLDEIDETVQFLHKQRAFFALLHCQSTYPASTETLNLRMIETLKNRYGVPVGYSGHEQGIDHSVTSVALGAKIIERHITFDQKAQGPDHAASLLPEQFKELVHRIRQCELALGIGHKQITRGEVGNKLALRKSLVATKPIKSGETIKKEMLAAKGPGTGLSPQRFYDLVGKKAVRPMKEDEMFMPSDLNKNDNLVKLQTINSQWGLKARFYEIETLTAFTPKQNFFIHAPEYNNRAPVDLASEDNKIWEDSIFLMQKTIDKTRQIAKHFTNTPSIVIHVGSMTLKPHKDPSKLIARGVEAFKRLDSEGVRLLPENLPAFGWFFGGLWHINAFGAAEEMIDFCKKLGLSMCLDLSHAWLYCNAKNEDYLEYIKKTAPYVGHLHIADGRGIHKEGLQIGEGDIPFEETFAILADNMPKNVSVSWVPEIWQGHVDNYREFKIALAKLSKFKFLKGTK